MWGAVGGWPLQGCEKSTNLSNLARVAKAIIQRTSLSGDGFDRLAVLLELELNVARVGVSGEVCPAICQRFLVQVGPRPKRELRLHYCQARRVRRTINRRFVSHTKHVFRVCGDESVELSIVAVAHEETWVELMHDKITAVKAITSNHVPGTRGVDLTVHGLQESHAGTRADPKQSRSVCWELDEEYAILRCALQEGCLDVGGPHAPTRVRCNGEAAVLADLGRCRRAGGKLALQGIGVVETLYHEPRFGFLDSVVIRAPLEETVHAVCELGLCPW